MTSPASGNPERVFGPIHGTSFVLMVAHIVVDRWMPGSVTARLLSIAFISSMTLWFGLRIRTGYIRRRPHWTRESWLHYLRLAAMPVAATFLVLAMSTERAIRMMGPAQSSTRGAWATVLVVTLLLGALGLARAVDWLTEGAAADQFTRRTWIPGRG